MSLVNCRNLYEHKEPHALPLVNSDTSLSDQITHTVHSVLPCLHFWPPFLATVFDFVLIFAFEHEEGNPQIFCTVHFGLTAAEEKNEIKN